MDEERISEWHLQATKDEHALRTQSWCRARGFGLCPVCWQEFDAGDLLVFDAGEQAWRHENC